MSTPTEEELVRQAARGSPTAFQTLTDRYYRPVCAVLLRRLGDATTVEDLAQETFLQALQALRAGRTPERFSSWLFGIAQNCLGKHLRRRRVLDFSGVPTEEIAEPNPGNPLEEAEETTLQMTILHNELAGLDPETRHLLDLKHQQGQTCEQMAAQLGRPVGTIKSLLSRAYKRLRERLQPSREEQP